MNPSVARRPAPAGRTPRPPGERPASGPGETPGSETYLTRRRSEFQISAGTTRRPRRHRRPARAQPRPGLYHRESGGARRGAVHYTNLREAAETHEGCPRCVRGTAPRDCLLESLAGAPDRGQGGNCTRLPTDPLVWSPQAAGAVPMVTASGGGSRKFHCVGQGDVGVAPGVAWRTPGLTVAKWASLCLPLLPTRPQSKGHHFLVDVGATRVDCLTQNLAGSLEGPGTKPAPEFVGFRPSLLVRRTEER